MLLREETLKAIARGDVTLAFRRWHRPTVRTGGTLLTAAGQLQIGRVTVVDAAAISDADARGAGYDSRDALLMDLDSRTEGDVYRVELNGLLPDPRLALRSERPDAAEVATLRDRLRRLDAASPVGAWTLKTLQVIRDNPALRAGDLCHLVGQDRERFKPNVRKLKNLGLTISLGVGYRLSPRGEGYLEAAVSEMRRVVDGYVEAYNAMVVDAMVVHLHPDVEFRNVANGEVTVESAGVAEFRKLAEAATALFESRAQRVLAFEVDGNVARAEIDYQAVLAVDVPPLGAAGDSVRLRGRSEFGFEGAVIRRLTDYSGDV